MTRRCGSGSRGRRRRRTASSMPCPAGTGCGPRCPRRRGTSGCRGRSARVDASSSGRRSRRREAQLAAAAGRGRAARDGARPEHVAERRGAGVRRAVTRRPAGGFRESRRRHPRRAGPAPRCRDGADPSRPAPRNRPPVRRMAAGFVQPLLRARSSDESQRSSSTSTGSGRTRRPSRIFGDDERYWCSVASASAAGSPCCTSGTSCTPTSSTCCASPTTRCVPVAPDMRAVNHVQVIGDELLLVRPTSTRRAAGSAVAPLTAPTEWRTLIPGERGHAADGQPESAAGFTPSTRTRRRIACASTPQTAAYLREVELPALGSVNHTTGDGVVSGVAAAGTATRSGSTSSRMCSRRRSIATTTRPTA